MAAIAFLQSATLSMSGAEPADLARANAVLDRVHRIVFLGDSITQAGDYVVDCDCWLLARGFHVEVLNLGLGSETASDLTPDENAGHLHRFGFGRPFVSERLDRALAATKPDLLFACYGMNDSGSLPPDETGTRRYAEAITRLRIAAAKAGVKRVVICTPPVFDNKGEAAQNVTDQNLARYTAWLLSKRADGWDVVDIHTPMRRALDEGRAKNPAFKFADDGVHPGREGHFLMAREILTRFFGANLDGVTSAEEFFPAHGSEIRKLVKERMVLLFDAWMTKIGHKRPGVPGGPGAAPGLPLKEANGKAADLTNRIRAEMAIK
jgi:lysophospholipase L1-like esterase